MFLSLSGSHSSGSWESVCSGGFPDVCELWTAVSYVCPLLDVSNGAFLLEHSLAADGRPGTRPDHPAADHTSAYRSVSRYLALLSQVTCTCFNLLHFDFSTGFFFFLIWALFTHQHIGEIRDDVSRLGPSYWLGVVGWASLLAVLPVVFLAEKFVVPDILPELKRTAEMWWKAPEVAHARSFSEGCHRSDHKSHPDFQRYLSVPWTRGRRWQQNTLEKRLWSRWAYASQQGSRTRMRNM